MFTLVFLAKMMVTVQGAFWEWISAEHDRIDHERASNLHRLMTVAFQLATNETARRVGLREGRKTRQAELQAKLEAVRPEFERLRAIGISKRRAAEILGPRYNVSSEGIRKRLK